MIKVKTTEQPELSKFPFIGICPANGDIVIFTGKDRGMLVKTKHENSEIGEYHNSWVMNNFIKFNGSITLSNES